jgi:hypothetical protein
MNLIKISGGYKIQKRMAGLQKTHGFLGGLGRALVKSDKLQESIVAQWFPNGFR